jgi:hypothetical protein
MRPAQMRHARRACLSIREEGACRILGCIGPAGVGSHFTARSLRSVAADETAAVAGLVCIRPADVLLQFDRQGMDRALGQITDAGFIVFCGKAADGRQDRHDTFLPRLRGLHTPYFGFVRHRRLPYLASSRWVFRCIGPSMDLTMPPKSCSIKRNEVMLWINKIEVSPT